MTGKKMVFIIIVAVIIGIIITWIFLQDVIKKYDLDTTMNTLSYINSSISELILKY